MSLVPNAYGLIDYRDLYPSDPFEMTYNGVAPFLVKITIVFKRGLGMQNITLTHMLNFEGRGEWNTIKLPMNSNVEKALITKGLIK